MEAKLNSTSEELSRKKRVLYLDYDESKVDIKQFLGEFMTDEYMPGRKIRESIDKSCNMIINYSRISKVEDPIDIIKQEMSKQEDTSQGAMGYLKQGLMSIGNSFGPHEDSKDTLQLPPARATMKASSFALDRSREEQKKAQPEKPRNQFRSSGIFDTLFKPLEPPSKKSVETSNAAKPQKVGYFGITKDNDASVSAF